MNRRGFVTQLAGMIAAGNAGERLWALTPMRGPGTLITVYKSSSCGCCAKWVDYVRAAGFEPVVHDEDDLDATKDKLGVPQSVRSCHTAVVDRYLIEGHVPAPDIRRLLSERPELQGLAVPGMPTGTPGMAPAGSALSGFEVIGFSTDGTRSVFSHY